VIPFLLLLVGLGRADAQTSYEAGIQAIDAGDFAAAEGELRAALEAGGRDPAVYHALGNALYRSGELGRAMAAWQRGLVLEPRNGDLASNLDRARGETIDRIDPQARTSPLVWQRALSTRESGLLGSTFVSLAIWTALVSRVLRRRGGEASSGLRWWGWASLGIGSLMMASTAVAIGGPEGAIVVRPAVTARSTAGSAGVDLFVLHEGAEVRVLDETADMTLVSLPDDRKGWMPRAAVVTTDPADPFPDE
jgi:hypothetical protein